MTKLKNESLTNYTGCPATYLMVLEQIKKRWGDKAAKHYDPARNCRTFNSWKNDMGRKVMRGQRALKSVTFIPVEDEHGEVIDCYKKTVNLFYYKQLERVIN
jgi:hypothetical protein